MGKTGKTRHGMQQNGKTERGEKKNKRRKGTKGKKTENEWKNAKTNKEAESTRLLRKSLGLMVPTPVIVLTG